MWLFAQGVRQQLLLPAQILEIESRCLQPSHLRMDKYAYIILEKTKTDMMAYFWFF